MYAFLYGGLVTILLVTLLVTCSMVFPNDGKKAR